MNFFHKMLINGQLFRDGAEKLSYTRSNRRLKHIAWGMLGMALCIQIIALAAIFIPLDCISWKTILYLEVFFGLVVVTYGIIKTIIVYRINKAFINERHDPRQHYYKDCMVSHERYCGKLDNTHKSDVTDVDGDSSD